MNRGFTLLEVVVALLLLEVAVVSAVGTLVLASRAMAEAEQLERAVVAAEGALDSLAGVDGPASGSGTFVGGSLAWSVDPTGSLELRASAADGSVLLDLQTVFPRP